MGARLLWGFVFFVTLSCVVGNVADAQIPSQLLPNCDFYNGQTYGLGAFVQLGVNVMKLIWGIAGSLALAMFVWGGFQWLTAAGEESKVKSGWTTLINAVIGLVIVFGSWIAINTVIVLITNPSGVFDTAKLFGVANTNTWTALVGQDTVCIKVGAHLQGNVPTATSPSATTRTSPAEHVACCYKRSADGAKQANELDIDACRQQTKDMFAAGTILGDPIFHCKYDGPIVSPMDLCWSVDTSRGNKPNYCNTRDDLSLGGSGTPTLPNISGVCCVSEEMHLPAPSFVADPPSVGTLESCQSNNTRWRTAAGQEGVFDLRFCPKTTDVSVCGRKDNGWRDTSCTNMVNFDPSQSAADIQRQINAAK